MTATQSMREILDQMKLNHAKELQKNRELSDFKRATNPPSQKKSSYEKIPNITPSLSLKRIFWARQAEVQKRIELIANGKEIGQIENEVETTQCKWCESSILKGRDYCSENCRRLYLTNNPIL